MACSDARFCLLPEGFKDLVEDTRTVLPGFVDAVGGEPERKEHHL
jgi:hypothetical protein